MIGGYFCGSGECTQYILTSQGEIVTKFSVSDYPVIIDTNSTNGWTDLIIFSGNKNRIIKFDGTKYPSNPSIEPAMDATPRDGLTRALDFPNDKYPWFKF